MRACVSAPPPQAQKIPSSAGATAITVGRTNLGHRRVVEAQHSHPTFTDKHFSSYCKVFSAAAATSRGPGDSQSRSIIFPNLLKKFLEKFCCPLFFIHRSIFQSIPVSLGFFFPDCGRFCVFLHTT